MHFHSMTTADVGVALLSGFGDVNVDKGEDGNKKKKDPANGVGPAALVGNTPRQQQQQLTVISPQERQAIRNAPVWAIKAKIIALGGDPKKYPELTTKEDYITLYEIKGKEVAIKRRDQKMKKEEMMRKKTEAKAKQREHVADKQKKMMERVKELEEQGVQFAQFKALQEFMANERAEGKKKASEIRSKNSVAGSAATIAGQLEDLEMDELPMVKIGDAR